MQSIFLSLSRQCFDEMFGFYQKATGNCTNSVLSFRHGNVERKYLFHVEYVALTLVNHKIRKRFFFCSRTWKTQLFSRPQNGPHSMSHMPFWNLFSNNKEINDRKVKKKKLSDRQWETKQRIKTHFLSHWVVTFLLHLAAIRLSKNNDYTNELIGWYSFNNNQMEEKKRYD